LAQAILAHAIFSQTKFILSIGVVVIQSILIHVFICFNCMQYCANVIHGCSFKGGED